MVWVTGSALYEQEKLLKNIANKSAARALVSLGFSARRRIDKRNREKSEELTRLTYTKLWQCSSSRASERQEARAPMWTARVPPAVWQHMRCEQSFCSFIYNVEEGNSKWSIVNCFGDETFPWDGNHRKTRIAQRSLLVLWWISFKLLTSADFSDTHMGAAVSLVLETATAAAGFCGEMRAGKLKVLVHCARLRTMIDAETRELTARLSQSVFKQTVAIGHIQ